MNPDLSNLFDEKEQLRTKIVNIENMPNVCDNLEELLDLEDKYDEVVDKISTLCGSKNKEMVDDYIGRSEDTFEGYSQPKVWSMMKKLAPKNTIDPPAAKRDPSGKLVTDKAELEQLYLDTYVEQLTPNPIKEDFAEIFEMKDMLFDMRMEESKHEVTEDWTLDELEKILKTLNL